MKRPEQFVLASMLLALGCASGCGQDEGSSPPSSVGPEIGGGAGDGWTDPDQSSDTPGSADTPGAIFPCQERAVVPLGTGFFTDISDESGIRVGNHTPDPPDGTVINDHSRLAITDIDGDGYDDIVMHSLYPNPQGGVPFEHLVMRNLGDGTFEDFSDASGLRSSQSGFLLFGDVDNDGDQDAFAGLDVPLGTYRHQILLNDGAGHFTVLAGSGVDSVSLTVAGNGVFADFDGDGDLDLFVGNGHTGVTAADLYFEGQGDGTFQNMSHKLPGAPAQRTNGTVTCDYDNDGDQDIFVSTYGVSVGLGLNHLWQNDGGTFTNVAVERGFASQSGGNSWLGYLDTPEPGKAAGGFMGSNGFGIDCKDINGDGLMDILLTTISHPVETDYSRKWSDPTQLLINQGAESGHSFLNTWTERGLPFNEGDVDGALVDFDNDGRLDISISRDKKYEKPYPEPDQKAWFGLMHQQADGSFVSLGVTSGINATNAALSASLVPCTADTECGDGEACLLDKCRRPCETDAQCPEPQELCHAKGFCKLYLAMKNAQNHGWADFDHDGDLDLVVGGRDTGGGRPNFLFRNDAGQENRSMSLRLEGDGVAVNRDAIGARVTLVWPDSLQVREVRSSRGMHVSADSRALHFGLGDRPCGYTVHVRWPDGTETSFGADEIPEERHVKLTYPDGIVWSPP